MLWYHGVHDHIEMTVNLIILEEHPGNLQVMPHSRDLTDLKVYVFGLARAARQ
jgi:hypothetical protein